MYLLLQNRIEIYFYFVVFLSFLYFHDKINKTKVFYRLEIKSTTLPDKCREPVKRAADVVQMIVCW